MRIREAGDSALVLDVGAMRASPLAECIDIDVNARAIAVARGVRRRAIAGVRDVVSTFRSVAVFFDPLSTDVAAVAAALHEESDATPPASAGRIVEVPVVYGGDAGPDLAQVAAFAGCSPEAVIERHAARAYRVFMLGFLPGFAYMGSVDETIAAPRRATPRLRVPAGSVGIAGRETGIYPRDSPGGWQIIGRTSVSMFDAGSTPPALLAPGDRVRFVPVDVGRGFLVPPKPPSGEGGTPRQADREGPPYVADVVSGFPGAPKPPGEGGSRTEVRLEADTPARGAARHVTVLRPGLLTTVQDSGRWGYQDLGVSVSGPMDHVAHRLANTLVGNPPDAATLEVTWIGPELRMEQETRVAVAGADLHATLDGADVPPHAAVQCCSGSVLRFGDRRSGVRAYVAFDGGIAVPPVLGSRATHTVSGLGGLEGRAVKAGDCIPLGHAGGGVITHVGRGFLVPPKAPGGEGGTPRQAGHGHPTAQAAGTSGPRYRYPDRYPYEYEAVGGARLRVLPGPQAEYFAPSALEALQRTRYTISPQSDRMGYRLAGGAPVPSVARGEMISDATLMGGVQLPPSGDPILLMADRQTSGG
ncbi:MAG: hypothetical protein HW394_460, partial [Acidobacteria bacterium]|nr:hypothetical protein [Acidobacteriota bacterium]